MKSFANLCNILIIISCFIWLIDCGSVKNCEHLWQDSMNSVSKGSQPEFEAAIKPFALAVKTVELYPDLQEDINGWTFISATQNERGMHAVAYQVTLLESFCNS